MSNQNAKARSPPLLGSPNSVSKTKPIFASSQHIREPLSTSSSDVNLAKTVSRNSLNENPILAPFTAVHSRNSSQSSSALYSSVFNRAVAGQNQSQNQNGSTKSSLTSSPTPSKEAKEFFSNKKILSSEATSYQNDSANYNNNINSNTSYGIINNDYSSLSGPLLQSRANSTTGIPKKQPPQIIATNENGSPIEINENKHMSVISEIPPGNKPRNILEESVGDMKANLKHDVVVRLNLTEQDLKSKLESFEKSLRDLYELRERSIKMIRNFEDGTNESREDISTQLASIRSSQIGANVVKDLEERIDKAKTRVEDCRRRLNHVNQQVVIQENDNKQRRKRIKYAKRASFVVVLFLSLLVMLVGQSLKSPRDFASIIQCLNDLDNCVI